MSKLNSVDWFLKFSCYVQEKSCRLIRSLVKLIAVGAGGLGFDSRAGQIGQCCHRLATAATFLLSCVAQALSREDRLPHSLHVLS